MKESISRRLGADEDVGRPCEAAYRSLFYCVTSINRGLRAKPTSIRSTGPIPNMAGARIARLPVRVIVVIGERISKPV